MRWMAARSWPNSGSAARPRAPPFLFEIPLIVCAPICSSRSAGQPDSMSRNKAGGGTGVMRTLMKWLPVSGVYTTVGRSV